MPFYGLKSPADFHAKLDALLRTLDPAVFGGDNLITWAKNLSFLEDAALMQAFHRNVDCDTERSLVWRTAVLAWAAKAGMRRAGDFVEAGCYRGTSARILCDYLGFGGLERRYYLYDLFEHAPDSALPLLPDHGPDLYEKVRARFADLPNVVIVKGGLPESLAVAAPERIALLHIDLNSAAAETGVLEALYDRVSDGAMIILDDYGWAGYFRPQKDAADAFFRARGNDVLELPTGQGIVTK